MAEPASLAALLDRVGPPTPGTPGVVFGAEGVGKTPLLVHVALHELLHGGRVVHVSLDDTVDHVRAHYDEIVRAAWAEDGAALDRTLLTAERHRTVLTYRNQAFSPVVLDDMLSLLAASADVRPTLIVLDGLDDAHWTHAKAIADLSARRGVPVWIGLATDASAPPATPASQPALRLTMHGGRMALTLVGDDEVLPWSIDPTTFVLGDGTGTVARAPDPTRITLFSGGAAGAEAAFGEAAAAVGVHEVHFTFDGHRQSRTVGSTELSPQELEAGDVSLVYVSRRLHRTYNQHGLIRKVLQTLWHMVSRAQQVFVVGVIQDDGTVVGGTGWSVELARMWSKELWVYDQEQDDWYTWDGSSWAPGTPKITQPAICGTGTRYLTDKGREAVDRLFQDLVQA